MSDHAEQSQAPHPSPTSGDARAPNAAHTAGHEPVVHGHEAPAPAPQDEGLPFGKVVLVAAVSIAIFAVGSAWAMKIRSATLRSMNPTGAAALPSSLGAEEQGMVDQIPFDLNQWVKNEHASTAERLRSYGWVDRQAGTIHIPIARAIELQLAEQKK